MFLHNDKDLFEKVILDTSEKYNIVPVIIEKDYFVTLFLKELVKRQSNIIFKGGTSLSKCYSLINRFSEDIDLNIDSDGKPTEGQRKALVTNVKNIIADYNFELKNPDNIRSRRDFNRFEVDVHALFSSDYIKHDLVIETAVFLRSYPNVKKSVSSYVYEYLKSIDRVDIIEMFELNLFGIQVQSVERTFIDKLFAICDYYIDGKTAEHSRHLYDLYKMSGVVAINSNLIDLFKAVREERKNHKICFSAQDGVNIKKCLQEIIDKDIYKNDYEAITAPLIFDKVSYAAVKDNLQKIVNSILFV